MLKTPDYNRIFEERDKKEKKEKKKKKVNKKKELKVDMQKIDLSAISGIKIRTQSPAQPLWSISTAKMDTVKLKQPQAAKSKKSSKSTNLKKRQNPSSPLTAVNSEVNLPKKQQKVDMSSLLNHPQQSNKTPNSLYSSLNL